MRRRLIQSVLPVLLCVLPVLAALLVAVSIPVAARVFYLDHLSTMDYLILGLGMPIFLVQVLLSWRALQWRDTAFDERPDRWLSSLAQAAEWFPLLGLLGTVAGILQTFGGFRSETSPEKIIVLFAPAITATGSGLLMALLNIFPTWMVVIGREAILTLSGSSNPVSKDSGYPAKGSLSVK
ncbi:MAG: MotA/TolQ/ExbB proton channel family protein [Gemmataceae bacterium]